MIQRDIVVVGGGPAGATTAIALAQAAPALASRVVLLERDRYPRDKPCAGALGGRGDAILRALGVAADVPSVAIHGISFRGRAGEAVAVPGSIGRVVRRVEFDHALARAAASRGVLVRDGVRISGVRVEGDLATEPGERGRGWAVVETSEGPVRACVVVGCDGVGSVVRKSLGLGAGSFRAQVIEVDTEPTPGDRDRGLIHFDASDPRITGYAWDFPTVVDGRALVSRGVYHLRINVPEAGGSPGTRARGPDVAALLDERLLAIGVDPAGRETRRYAERGFEPASRIARGPVMLVGEAVGIDPATGEGIAQAVEYGALAGRFLARRLAHAGAGPLDVGDWVDEVAASRLARDLRIRTRAMGLFHGAARGWLEGLLTRSPDLLYVGCQHFAAQRFDWTRVGRVAVRGAATALASRIR
jgi:menaquinone-9 beta-reductase